jgi:hypothetical protein
MKNYYIKCAVHVSVDDFTDGQGECVNYWELNAHIKAYNPLDAVKQFYAKELYWSFEEKNAHIEQELNGVNVLLYSNYVDNDNIEIAADSKEMAEFAQGKRSLFVANSYIEIFELIPATI